MVSARGMVVVLIGAGRNRTTQRVATPSGVSLVGSVGDPSLLPVARASNPHGQFLGRCFLPRVWICRRVPSPSANVGRFFMLPSTLFMLKLPISSDATARRARALPASARLQRRANVGVRRRVLRAQAGESWCRCDCFVSMVSQIIRDSVGYYRWCWSAACRVHKR
jgi:hypothetical protein